MKLSDVSVKQLIVALWVLFSVGYVGLDVVQGVIQQGYVSGKTEMVVSLLSEAKKCQPFDVFAGEQKLSLIAVDCLKGAQATGSGVQK